MKKNLSVYIYALLLICLGFVLYSQTLKAGFVWDDHLLIDENPQMATFKSVKSFFTKDMWENSTAPYKSGFYRPITLSSFLIDQSFYKGRPFGFHCTNIILHITNSLLLFGLANLLLRKQSIAFITSLIFLSHPVQVETVAFISDRGDLLCVYFLLLSCLCYVLYRQKERFTYLTYSSLALIGAFLSKENAMIGFVLIALIEWFFFAKLKFKVVIKKIPILAIYVALTAIYILWRAWLLGGANAVTTLGDVRYVSILPGYNFGSHLLLVVNVLVQYLILVIVPIKQSIAYVILPPASLFDSVILAKILLLIGIVILIGSSYIKKRMAVTFALVWFFITLLPMSNLIPISNTVAERFLYLPMVGGSLFLGYAIVAIYAAISNSYIYKMCLIIGLVVGILICVRTYKRTQVWHNDYTLFSSALDYEPCAPIAYKNLATYYAIQGDLQRSVAYRQYFDLCANKIQQLYRKNRP